MKALKCDNCGQCYDYDIMSISQLAWCKPDGVVIGMKDLCPECLEAVSKALEDMKMRKMDNPLEDDLK